MTYHYFTVSLICKLKHHINTATTTTNNNNTFVERHSAVVSEVLVEEVS